MYSSVWATIRKYYRLNGLNKKNILSHSSGEWTSEMEVLSRLVAPKAFLSDL